MAPKIRCVFPPSVRSSQGLKGVLSESQRVADSKKFWLFSVTKLVINGASEDAKRQRAIAGSPRSCIMSGSFCHPPTPQSADIIS